MQGFCPERLVFSSVKAMIGDGFAERIRFPCAFPIPLYIMRATLAASLILVLLLPQTPGSAEEKVDFTRQILPVLEARCMECHRSPYEENGRTRRPRGGLIMDTAEGLLAGGSSGDVLVAGDAEASYLVEVVHLPEDDDMFMPPNRPPLTDEELALLTRWVNEGADMTGWHASTWDQIQASIAAYEAETQEEADIYTQLAANLEFPGDEVIGAVEVAGGRVTRLAQGSPLVRVDFLNAPDSVTEEAMAAVAGLGANLVQLELGRSALTDAGLQHVRALPNLVRLDVHQTQVGDSSLASLGHLGHLQYLNLYGTAVTDGGLRQLADLKGLRQLYVWQTEVTEAGAAALREQLPELTVVGP